MPCRDRDPRKGAFDTTLRFGLAVFVTLTSWVLTPPALRADSPTAMQMEEWYQTGLDVGRRDTFLEGVNTPPSRDLLHYRLDMYLKEHGAEFTDLQRELFIEGYWQGFQEAVEGWGTLRPERDITGTTTLSGTTSVPGPGTLQVTDESGRSYFIRVQQDGKYSRTLPRGKFQPVRMTLRTETVKASWELKDGTWVQTSGVTRPATPPPPAPPAAPTTPTQGVMVPGPPGPTLVAAGQSGFASLVPGRSAGPPGTAKGHMTFVGTAELTQQRTASVRLESLAHLEEEHADESPETFLGLPTGAAWGWSERDAQPPTVAPVSAAGDFALAPSAVAGMGLTWKPCLNLGIGYHALRQPLEGIPGDRELQVTLNTHPYFTGGLRPGADVGALRDAFTTAGTVGGVRYGWDTWYTGFDEAPVLINGQISERDYTALAWDHPGVMLYGEVDPGILVKPLPGLDWHTWPAGEGSPLPRFTLTLRTPVE